MEYNVNVGARALTGRTKRRREIDDASGPGYFFIKGSL
jgi:hypothetical protein